MNQQTASINLDRGTQGDEGHFVTIQGRAVFIADDHGAGANGKGGKFTKHGLEKRILDHHKERGGDDADTHRRASTRNTGDTGQYKTDTAKPFHFKGDSQDDLPGEVKQWIDGDLHKRSLFTVSRSGNASGADVMAEMGDKYFDMADEALGGKLNAAKDTAKNSDDPEMQFIAAIHDNLPKTKTATGIKGDYTGKGGRQKMKVESFKVTQGVMKASKLRDGHNFTINGTKLNVVDRDGALHVEGHGYPSTPVDALSEIPIDKHSLKMGKKSVSREVVPFSRAIELSAVNQPRDSKGRWTRLDGIHNMIASVGPKNAEAAFKSRGIALAPHEAEYVREYAKRVKTGHFLDLATRDKIKAAIDSKMNLSATIELSRKELTGGRWVTIHPHGGHGDGDYKRLYIKGDGTIMAGPKAMVGKNISHTHDTHETREADHPQSPLRKESSFTAQTVDPNRQLGMFAKDKDGNAMEVGEKPGQASLFHDTAKAKPVVDKAQAKRDEDAKATTEMFPAKKAEDATDRREKMIRDAQALRYLAVKMIPDDMPTRAQLRVSDATTKGDIDKWLMKKYGVEADVARDASNQALTERGTHRSGSGGSVRWTGGGTEPTSETHPDVAQHVNSIIQGARTPKKPETVPGDTGKIGSMHPDLVTGKQPEAKPDEKKADGGGKTYRVGEKHFDSFLQAVAEAKSTNGEVIENATGNRRWHPIGGVSAKKMREYHERQAAYKAQQQQDRDNENERSARSGLFSPTKTPTAADTIAKMKTDDVPDSNDLDGSALRDLKAKSMERVKGKQSDPVVSRSLAVFATLQNGGNEPAAKPEALPDTLPPGVSLDDIPLDLAVRAHSGTSFSPEVRGKTRQNEYVEKMKSAYAEMSQHATTPEQKERLASEFERYRKGYAEHYKSMLGSMSNIVSPMIAGPANFPVRQMEKRNRWADNKRQALHEFHEKAMNAARRNINPDWNGVIRADDPNAVAKIDTKLAEAKKWHEAMKSANAIVKKHGDDPVAVRQKLTEIGIPEDWQSKILKPDYMGRTGFPSYAITNSNANIRRMEERSKSVAEVQSSQAVEQKHGDVTYSEHPDDVRVRLTFPGKPDSETISKLKRNGFRWSPTNGAWQRQLNNAGRYAAKNVLKDIGKYQPQGGQAVQMSTAFYLSASSTFNDATVELTASTPTHFNGAEIHYKWQDAAISGNWKHPTKGFTLNIDNARIDKWVKGIELARSNGVDLPIVKDHKETADSTLGYIYGARQNNGRLELLNGYIGADSLAIAQRNKLSIGIDPNFKDSHGTNYGEAIRHVAVTPIPVIHGQQGFLAASRDGQQEPEYLIPVAKETKDMTLTDEQRKEICDVLGVEHVDDDAAISLLTATVTDLQNECLTLSAAKDEASAKLLELSAAEPVIVEPSKADPELVKTKIELSAAKGDITKHFADGLNKLIDSEPLLLSREGDGKPAIVLKFLELFDGAKLGAKSVEKTGVQMLSREVPDGETAPAKTVNPYEDTIARLTGSAK